MWEDNRNRLGGRWLVNLSRNARTQDLDKMWLETVSPFYLFHFFPLNQWWQITPTKRFQFDFLRFLTK